MPYKIVAACTGCGLCKRTCPVEAITGEQKGKHEISLRRCVNCGACGMVCNFHAIVTDEGKVAEKVALKDRPRPVIDRALCSACSICVSACTKQVLAISLPTFQGDIHVFAELVNEKSCVSCGLCARDCPLDAITMKRVEEK